jgi:guanyl-specific ribonuclease Sa
MMKNRVNKYILILLSMVLIVALFIGCSTVVEESEPAVVETPALDPGSQPAEPQPDDELTGATLDEDGYYSSQEEVALYINTYGKLPINYITKSEASKLGWDSQKGNLWEVTDKMIIGGDKFGNREKLLPIADGRIYYECDVNYEGGYRGSERLVFSNDGLIFYTEDHYESFEQLY